MLGFTSLLAQLALSAVPLDEERIVALIQTETLAQVSSIDLRTRSVKQILTLNDRSVLVNGGLLIDSGRYLAIELPPERSKLSFGFYDMSSGACVGAMILEGTLIELAVPNDDSIDIVIRKTAGTVEHVKITCREGKLAKSIMQTASAAVIRELMLKNHWVSELSKQGFAIGNPSQVGSNADTSTCFDNVGPGRYAAMSSDGKRCAALVRPASSLDSDTRLVLRTFKSEDVSRVGFKALEKVAFDASKVMQLLLTGDWLVIRYSSGLCEVRSFSDPQDVIWTFRSDLLLRSS